VRRSRHGYRRFTERHLDHLRLARLLRGTAWPGHAINRSALELILKAARDGPGAAEGAAVAHLALVRAEQAHAARACAVVRGWLEGLAEPAPPGVEGAIRPGEAVRRSGASYDSLRSWERNGLLATPRDQASGERRFRHADLDRIEVIRALRTAGYSPMAILRMLQAADSGDACAAIGALADPELDPDLLSASDRWQATLADHERRASDALDLVRRMAAAS
jgi:DNA-binding transcriptional MerR regulator